MTGSEYANIARHLADLAIASGGLSELDTNHHLPKGLSLSDILAAERLVANYPGNPKTLATALQSLDTLFRARFSKQKA